MKRNSRLTRGVEGYAWRLFLVLGLLIVGAGIFWILLPRATPPPATLRVPIPPPPVPTPLPGTAPPAGNPPIASAAPPAPAPARPPPRPQRQAPGAARTLPPQAQARPPQANAPAPPATLPAPGPAPNVAPPPPVQQPSPVPVPAAPAAPQPQNGTDRAITLTIPLKDGTVYLGDISVTIRPNDRVEFSSQRLIDLLANVLTPQALDALKSAFADKPVVTPADVAPTGITAVYNPQTLELVLTIPPAMKAARSLALTALDRERFGMFVKPATFAAYMNVRGAIDYVYQGPDKGLGKPIFFLDGAARTHDVAVESEGVWQPGARGTDFQRQGSRIVYDDLDRLIRWTAGDLVPVGRGFQSVPDMGGVSLLRSYSILQPQRVVRPRGDRAFQIDRPSDVEISVNGQIVRRLRLDPGVYNLQDFPFTQGANDVVVSIRDDTGRQQTFQFNVFFDQTQLEPGLSEFGAFLGAKAPLTASGPHYSDDWAFSGFYRYGVAEDLTLGANLQADAHSRMAAIDGLWGSPIGTIGFDVALSSIENYNTGYAARFTLQRLFRFVEGTGDSLSLSLDTRSKDFGPMGTIAPNNLYAYELGAAYTHAFNDRLYAGVDAHFSKGRGVNPDVSNYRATVDYRLTPDIGLAVNAGYEDSATLHGLSLLVSLTMRLSQSSATRADYDTREDRARLSYQALSGEGVGSYNVSADLERTPHDSGLNATANYFANRADLGISHFTTFDGTFGGVQDKRTSAQVGTSLAFADGAFSVGRPVFDSFAIVEPHASLAGAEVIVNPSPTFYTSSNDSFLDTALENNLSAYAERTITVDVPNAPQGYDLGSGSYRLFPGHRSGYVLEVGSDYSITAIGRLVSAEGEPVALLAGRAIEVARPEREPVTVFTNRDGRFGASGLRPGRWRIEMPTDPDSVFILDIPANAVGAVRTGDLKPTPQTPPN